MPVTLEEYLLHHDEIKSLYLHLDNDKAGHDTSEKIKIVLHDKYDIFDKTPQGVNDINEFLQQRNNKNMINKKQLER